MITDEEIDKALMRNITNYGRTVPRVVGTAMSQIDKKERSGKDDLYFAKRVVEYEGNLNEIRLIQSKENTI